ncbi:hypothetical protein U1Q18_031412, partial [Sarracenia purpurea var. burkii]
MPVGRRSAKPSSASRPAQTAPRSGLDAKLATKSRPDRIPTRGLMQSSTTGSHTELGDSTRPKLGTPTRARQNVPLGHFIKQQQRITHLPKSSTTRNCIQSDHRRGCDDDEPLLSPTDGGRCVPIPEVEDEDGEVEEFQGFVNPLSSSSGESAFNCGDSKNAEVSLMLEAAMVTVGRSHHMYAVVLRVEAPLPPSSPRQPAHDNNSAHFLNPSRRAPIDLLTVLYQCYVCQMPFTVMHLCR